MFCEAEKAEGRTGNREQGAGNRVGPGRYSSLLAEGVQLSPSRECMSVHRFSSR
jgi:hypothetical protein